MWVGKGLFCFVNLGIGSVSNWQSSAEDEPCYSKHIGGLASLYYTVIVSLY